MKTTVFLIGYGTVGKALYQQLSEWPDIHIAGIGVKHKKKHTKDKAYALITDDPLTEIENESIDVVLEAIDDASDAFIFAQKTLSLGKAYISANKKMLAEHLNEVKEVAQMHQAPLYFEAAVAGAIPILSVLREHFSREPIAEVKGILNGSTNFILTQMLEKGWSFEIALEKAQALGFAESDPSLDVEGTDAWYKTALLAFQAFDVIIPLNEISKEGIDTVRLTDLIEAQASGEKIKLVSKVEKKNGKISASVSLERITPSSPLYYVDNEQNAVMITGGNSREIVLQGAGAGGAPTASAMSGDLGKVLNRQAVELT